MQDNPDTKFYRLQQVVAKEFRGEIEMKEMESLSEDQTMVQNGHNKEDDFKTRMLLWQLLLQHMDSITAQWWDKDDSYLPMGNST